MYEYNYNYDDNKKTLHNVSIGFLCFYLMHVGCSLYTIIFFLRWCEEHSQTPISGKILKGFAMLKNMV